MTAINSPKGTIKSALSAFALVAVVSLSAGAHPHLDNDDNDDEKVITKKVEKKINIGKNGKRRTVTIVRDGKSHEVITDGAKWHIDGVDIDKHIQFKRVSAIEKALDEVRSALGDVQKRLKASKKRSDKKALTAAKDSLEKAIEALEEQREIRGEHMAMVSLDGAQRHRIIEIEREAVREALEGLDEQAQELLESRTETLRELAEVRVELADEIADLQIEIGDGEDMHVIRLRALREAELAISDMEEHHLAAIKQAEAELKRARERLEKKLEKQKKARKAKKADKEK